jgi:hypothetical protein
MVCAATCCVAARLFDGAQCCEVLQRTSKSWTPSAPRHPQLYSTEPHTGSQGIRRALLKGDSGTKPLTHAGSCNAARRIGVLPHTSMAARNMLPIGIRFRNEPATQAGRRSCTRTHCPASRSGRTRHKERRARTIAHAWRERPRARGQKWDFGGRGATSDAAPSAFTRRTGLRRRAARLWAYRRTESRLWSCWIRRLRQRRAIRLQVWCSLDVASHVGEDCRY